MPLTIMAEAGALQAIVLDVKLVELLDEREREC